jgi:hypothetical protein
MDLSLCYITEKRFQYKFSIILYKVNTTDNFSFNSESILDSHIAQNGDADDDYPHCPVWERRKLFMLKNPRGDKYRLDYKLHGRCTTSIYSK